MPSLREYLYDLPSGRIAKYPLAERELSKLLKYENGSISHHSFRDAVELIPNDALLMFNNTKVISARLFFYKETGAKIEVFLSEPTAPFRDFRRALAAKESCTWKCLIGNVGKWKRGKLKLVTRSGTAVFARLEDREKGLVQFEWAEDISFLDIIESGGNTPLPPYLSREAERSDKARYQTVFSEKEGAVAAPTAGLHFTERMIEKIKNKGVQTGCLTLHVGAGTFRPIKEEDFTRHAMHSEKVFINRQSIEKLLAARGKTIAVGTTAMRTLESSYWYGVKLLNEHKAGFHIDKMMPYRQAVAEHPSKREALEALLQKMDAEQIDTLSGETEIFIYPGYDFKICDGLFTNYHQPGSTLILLVAAFVGEHWKEIYREALSKDYRFLSYGDASLLFR